VAVSSTSSHVVYTGNGATTSFPFAFKIKAAADLVVCTNEAGRDFTLSPSQYGATGFGQTCGRHDDSSAVEQPDCGKREAPGANDAVADPYARLTEQVRQ
jgi:hypothetical protein